MPPPPTHRGGDQGRPGRRGGADRGPRPRARGRQPAPAVGKCLLGSRSAPAELACRGPAHCRSNQGRGGDGASAETDFAASWLDLREPADHRSRNRALARALSAHVGGVERLAIADLGWIRLTGFLAWVLWGIVHIFFLIGFRNRIVVALDWLWSYLTYQRGARLITGEDM